MIYTKHIIERLLKLCFKLKVTYKTYQPHAYHHSISIYFSIFKSILLSGVFMYHIVGKMSIYFLICL